MSRMSMPFPDRKLAEMELERDSCYGRIPEKDRKKIADQAWLKGETAAEMVFKRSGKTGDFTKIAQEGGLSIERIDVDYISGNQRYFSDYLTGQKKIHLYMKSIALWAAENQFSTEEAVNLILSHEYYHFLEWTEIGLTSREYQVPILKLGPIKLGRTGIRALSEIGAHAFARHYEELLSKSRTGEKGENETGFEL